MSRPRLLVIAVTLAVVLLVAGAVGISSFSNDPEVSIEADAAIVAPADVASAGGPAAATLEGLIEQLETRLDVVPGDHVAWSTLGLAYVQQARVVADPSLYPRAQSAFDESLAVEPDENFLAFAGLSALASARHAFVLAKEYAEEGLAANDFSAILWGALSDAQVQLGEYAAATDAVERMLGLSPDTSSYSRSSYLAQLNGDTDLAIIQMRQALEQAGTPTDRAFALSVLGEIEFNRGDPAAALELYNQARAQAPQDTTALAGKARAEAALGQVETALDHYRELVEQAPEPSYLIAYGELLESLGRVDEAEVQYDVVEVVQTLFEANGVESDAAPVLFLADHDEPERALAEAERAIAVRPFLAMHDAHAWALHRNGRHDEALVAIGKAFELDTPEALWFFHSGEIKRALGDIDGAQADLERALEINPFFDPLDVAVAEASLAEIVGS